MFFLVTERFSLTRFFSGETAACWLLAQGGGAGGGGDFLGGSTFLLPLVLTMVVMYLFLLRPENMNASLLPLLLAANKYRLINYDFPQILPDSLQISTSTLIVLALIAISITAGIMFAKAVRMRDYGWKVSLILSTILVSTFVVLF